MIQISHRLAKSVLAIALLGSLGGALHAQTKPATPAPATAAPVSPADTLRTELKITDAQESAWKQFTDAYSLPFRPSQEMSGEQFNSMNTPERIAFLKKLRAEETSFLASRLDASMDLYNALDNNQKKKFDDMTAQPVAAKAAATGKSK